jgi:hypothetical protein
VSGGRPLLDGRLIDMWHQLKGHRYVKQDGGGRGWVAPPPVVSLDALRDRQGDDVAAEREDRPDAEPPFDVRLRNALREGVEEQVALCSRVAVMRADGMSQREVADDLGLPVSDVRDAERWLADAVGRMA